VVSPNKNHRGKTRRLVKTRRILRKVVRLIMFLGDESLYGIGPQVVVYRVDVHKGLVRLSIVAGNTKTSPANFELHGRSSVSIPAVADD
jgi:hypothetical protein